MCFRFIRAGPLCVAMCLITLVAHAQQGRTSSLGATGVWRSSDLNAVVIPRLDRKMANLTRFQMPEALPDYERDWTTSQSGFQPMAHVRSEAVAALAEDLLLPPATSFFGVLNAQYVVWEKNLSHSRSLTNVGGTLVYPSWKSIMLIGVCPLLCTHHRFEAAP